LEERRGELSETSISSLAWGLSHLSPHFSEWQLREIDPEGIDEYRTKKTRQAEARRQAIAAKLPERDESGRIMRPLSPASINKSIDVLRWVLAIAEERGLIDRNPARGRRRRVPTRPPAPVFLDSATQIEALLNAAARLDRQSESRTRGRLPLIGTLVFAGLRSGELSVLRCRDVDLAAGRILVRQSKTAAGQREVSMLPVLRSLLTRLPVLASGRRPEEYVFATRNGLARSKDNIRACMLLPAKVRADLLLEREGRPPLPLGLSPHKLRHTFASILVACGEDPVSVMYELGHTTPVFTLRTYSHMMRRDPGERERLRLLVSREWEPRSN